MHWEGFLEINVISIPIFYLNKINLGLCCYPFAVLFPLLVASTLLDLLNKLWAGSLSWASHSLNLSQMNSNTLRNIFKEWIFPGSVTPNSSLKGCSFYFITEEEEKIGFKKIGIKNLQGLPITTKSKFLFLQEMIPLLLPAS